MGKWCPHHAANAALFEFAVAPSIAGHKQAVASFGFVKYIIIGIVYAVDNLALSVNLLKILCDILCKTAIVGFINGNFNDVVVFVYF